jgi:hypothetical protein
VHAVLAKNFDVPHFLVEAITELIAEVAKKLNVVAKNGRKIASYHDCRVRQIVFFLTCFSPAQGPSATPPAAWCVPRSTLQLGDGFYRLFVCFKHHAVRACRVTSKKE